MPALSVHVQPAVLDWAMQQAQTRRVANSVIDMIEKWITGEKTPTFHQIEEISRKICIPFGYFFLEKPPVEECEIVDFRTIDSVYVQNPSRDLIETVDQMSLVQEWMAEYNKKVGLSENAGVGRIRISDRIADTAAVIRKELNISECWFDEFKNAAEAFRGLRGSISTLGILVMMNGVVGNNTHRVLDVNEFRAFTLIDSFAPLIFINSRDTENGRLFSLLHELVHVWLGKDSLYNDPHGLTQTVSREEQFCNAVAAEILVPNKVFLSEWSKQIGKAEDIISALENVFICSRFVLLRKALDTGRIEVSEYGKLSRMFQKQFEEKLKHKNETAAGQGDFYRTLGTKWDRNFLQALHTSAQSGGTSYRDVYRLTNTTSKTFRELIGRVGGR